MSRTTIAAILAICFAASARSDDLAWLDAYYVVWTSPSRNSGESMPCAGDETGTVNFQKANMHLCPEGKWTLGEDKWGQIVRVNMLKITAADWAQVPGVKKAWPMKGFEGVEGMAFHPVSHNISEGRRMVQARKYDRICQVGTQYRSDGTCKAAARFIAEGKLGKVTLARSITYKRRGSIGSVVEAKPPDSVDYNLWAGPAPMSRVTRRNFHYDWHWFWETGNGDIGMAAGSGAFFDPDGKLVEKFSGPSDDHFGNFIEAVRSRDRDHLNAEVFGGHLSAGLCHLGNISYRLGRPATLQEILKQLASQKLLDDPKDTFERTKKHLADNGVDIEKTQLTVGPWLQFDPDKEQFVNNSAADAMLTREYRRPFVVPTESEV